MSGRRPVLAVVVALVVLLSVLHTAMPGRPAPALALAVAVDPGEAGPLGVEEIHVDQGPTAFQPDGFPGRVELESQLYLPTPLTGRAPVVVLLHGRHVTCADDDRTDLVWPCPADLPEVPSYLGYAALARHLASHGFVVASIGANGVNAADGYLADGGAAARAELVLAHLRLLARWDQGSGSGRLGRLAHHLDLRRVGLMGHSRGGEGVVAAAQLNQRIGAPFGIEAVLALAPVDFSRRVLGGAALGVVLPYCDGDVSDLQGSAYYDDARYASPGDPAPKLTALLYGANHNFFNRVWSSGPGSGDDTEYLPPIDQEPRASGGAADPCAAGSPARLTPAAQEQAGVALMGGFFRRYLLQDRRLQPLVTGVAPFPTSVGGARWTVAYHEPDRLDIARFDTPDQLRANRFDQVTSSPGASPAIVCSGAAADDEVAGPAVGAPTPCPGTPEVWATNTGAALDVGWVGREATVRQPLSARGTDVTRFDSLRLRVAVPVDARNQLRPTQDLSVVLEDTSGRRASVAVAGATNALRPVAAGRVAHALLKGVRLPLARFRGVDLSRLRAVELRFDRTPAGRVWVSDLAFTTEGTGAATGPTEGAAALSAPAASCRSSAARRWACALAAVTWGRDPSDEEVAYLAAGYATAARRRAVAAAVVAGSETEDLFLVGFVQRYAQVAIEPTSLPDYFIPGVARSWEADAATLAGSFAGAPRLATTRQQVEAAHQTLLGRPATAGEHARWAPIVAARGPEELIRSLQASPAARGRTVDHRYRSILGRAPTAGERRAAVAALARPHGEQRLVTDLVASESFRAAVVR